MKSILLIGITLLSFSVCRAQRVTYNDLKYVLYHSVSQTEDYLSEKRFSYGGIDTINAEANAVEYLFTKNSNTSINYISIAKHAISNKFYEVSFFTISQNDYLLFKSAIKKLGFIAQPSETNKQTLIFEYKKGKLTVSIWIQRDKTTDATDYDISLNDSDLDYSARHGE